MLRLVARTWLVAAALGGVLPCVMAQAPGSFGPPPADTAQPAGYYSPQYAMAQPTTYYPWPQYSTAQRPAYSVAGNGYATPNGAPGNYGVVPRSAPTMATPTVAAPAPAAANNMAPTPMGATGARASGYASDEGCGEWNGGALRHWGGALDMPQHYPYYPPMHGYYYFRPYNYMHVPTQQAYATQFGVDPRNPYSNDFFKVVYAEYKASLLRSSPEHVTVPPGTVQGPVETPAEMIKKLKTLKDDGALSQEEYESKKAEILGRM
jgi:hypothetical protein